MDDIRFIILIWALHAVIPGIITFFIVLLSGRRVRWYPWELMAFILPFCILEATGYFFHAPSIPKGLGNAFGDPIYVGFTIPVAALLRVVAGRGRQTDQRMFALIALLTLCAIAAVVYFLSPYSGGNFG